MRIESCSRLVARVAYQRPQTCITTLTRFITVTTTTMNINSANGLCGTCSHAGIEAGSGFLPSTLSTTNFVAAGGPNPRIVETVSVASEK